MKVNLNLHTLDLAKLNSLTKYPSIPTYHELDPKNGNLLESPVKPVKFSVSDTVIITEKIDGTNARIIVLPDGSWVIGSREELLTAKGDLIPNPKLGIVDTLRPLVNDLVPPHNGEIWTYYLEVYGSGVGPNAKQYTTSKTTTSCRVFDIGVIGDVSRPDDIAEKFTWSREKIASWREHGGQHFMYEFSMAKMISYSGLDRVPIIDKIVADRLPVTVQETNDWLQMFRQTDAALDESAKMGAEGVVLRTASRTVVAKARFEDYTRTLRRRTS